MSAMDATTDPQHTTRKRRLLLWKWSMAVTGLVLTSQIWLFVPMIVGTRNRADDAALRFHEQLNLGDYKGICADGTEPFRYPPNCEELLTTLTTIHDKLGNSISSAPKNLSWKITTTGLFITAQYEGTFEKGSAIETFTWRDTRKGLETNAYGIESDAL